VKRLVDDARVSRRAAREERDGALAVQFGQDAQALIIQANELIDRSPIRVVHDEHGPGRVSFVDSAGYMVVDLDAGWTTSATGPELADEAPQDRQR
jgi:hypothetical protein